MISRALRTSLRFAKAFSGRTTPLVSIGAAMRGVATAFLLATGTLVAAAQVPMTFPATPVATASTAVTVTVAITGNATAAAPRALSQGVANADYTVDPSGTCAAGTAYTTGQTCTVSVIFKPKAPGLRLGAVVLTSTNGSVLGETLISGTGTGPLAVLEPGRIDTVVGSGQWIYRGDGVAATTAPIFLPMGVVVDAAGNIFLSDANNNRIRRVDGTTGIITTVGGDGVPGFSGDNGPATSASVSSPSGIVLDGAGNIFFDDTGNDSIRRIDAVTGVITTVAGTSSVQGNSGDGGLATSAKLSLPQGLAVDAAGNLFIADTGNNAVRRVDAATHMITPVAGAGSGQGTGGYNGDNRLAAGALMNTPWSVIVAADGTLYIADLNNDRIRKISTAGIITTVAGTGVKGTSGDGGSATSATLNEPAALALDPAGNLYIADSGNNRVRKVTPSTGLIENITGTGSEAFAGDTGPANMATLYGPYALFFDSKGNLLIADMFHNRIRTVSAAAVALKFDTLRVSKVSPPQAEALVNAGNADLTLTTPLFNNSALDAATTTCNTGTVVASDFSCNLGVEFAPTVTGDPVIGTLTQGSNASNTPAIITLSGTVLAVEPTTLSLISSSNPSLVNTAVTFTATVTSADPTRSGPVVFLDGSTQICSTTLSAAGTATCTTATLTIGQHTITANYAGDANNSSASATLMQIVKQPSNLALTAAPNPAIVTSTVTLTATATGASGIPTGTITFYDGTVALGSSALNGQGIATYSTSALLPGTRSLSAQYGGDAGNASAISPTVSEVISQATTITTLSTSNASVPVGTSITFTANVSSTNGPAPTGTVKFLDGAATIGSIAVSSTGVSTLTLSTLAPGTHSITAVYSGDTDDATSSSSALSETVLQIATSTLLGVDINPANAGGTINLTATVLIDPSATPAGALTGQVTFKDGTATLGTAMLNATGTATLTLNTLTVGSHTITAVYAGNTNYSGSTSTQLTEVIKQTATTTSLSASSPTSLSGKPVTFTATVTSSTGIPTGSVTFKDGSITVGVSTLTSGVATLVLTNLSVGAHTITAFYNGDANYIASNSTSLTETISLGTSTLTLTGPTATVNAGTAVPFTVALGTDGVAPTGTLTLSDGGTVIATQSVAATGTFTFSISSLAVGTHIITAVYSGDTNTAPGTSNSVTVVVQLTPTNTTLQSSKNPQVLGQTLTLTATVTSVSPNAGGSVNFLDGATSIGSAPLNASGIATLTTTSLTFGSHTITAVYAGDTNHATSTSAVLNQSIVQTATATVTSSANPAIANTNIIFTATITGVGSVVPTGLVTFLDGATILGTATLGTNGTATYSTASLAVGSHPITISYAGDPNYAPAVSAVLTETVQNESTQVTLTSTASPAIYGTPLTFTAVVKTNGGIATGNVLFTEGGVTLGTSLLDATGTATFTTTALTPGPHTVIANYTGDSKASTSVSTPLTVSVLQLTSVALNSSINPSPTLNAITFTVTVSNNGLTVPTGTVVFTDGSVKLGSVAVDATGHATLAVPSLAAGNHTITAAYSGDTTNFPGTSAALVEAVQLRPTTNTLTATATSTTNNQQVTLISVVRFSGTVVPTGVVTFTSGGNTVGTANVDATGVATLTIFVQSTTQTIIAHYAGDASYAASDSLATSVTGGPATQFTLSLNPSSMSVQSKQHGVITLTLTSVKDFTDTLEFGCLGLPYAATCTFDATQMVLQPNGTSTMKMTLDTGNPLGAGSSASLHSTNTSGVLMCALPGGMLIGLVFWRKRRVRIAGLLLLLCALGATISATGCSGININGTPAGTYTFQVSAQGKGTGATQAQTMTLTVTE